MSRPGRLIFVVKEVVKLVGPTLVLAGRRSPAAYRIWMMLAAPHKHASRNKKYMFFITEAIFFFFVFLKAFYNSLPHSCNSRASFFIFSVASWYKSYMSDRKKNSECGETSTSWKIDSSRVASKNQLGLLIPRPYSRLVKPVWYIAFKLEVWFQSDFAKK